MRPWYSPGAIRSGAHGSADTVSARTPAETSLAATVTCCAGNCRPESASVRSDSRRTRKAPGVAGGAFREVVVDGWTVSVRVNGVRPAPKEIIMPPSGTTTVPCGGRASPVDGPARNTDTATVAPMIRTAGSRVPTTRRRRRSDAIPRRRPCSRSR
jgi:hypothetical protein